jgi:prevent-host-death family protein
MKSVGLRELKNRLSEFIREVRSGDPVLVTDRGEVVAELIPPGQGGDERSAPSVLVALARKGQLTLGFSNDAAAYPKLPRLLKRHRSAELLNGERGAK